MAKLSVVETVRRPISTRKTRDKKRSKRETKTETQKVSYLTAEQFFAYYALFASLVFTMMFIVVALVLGGA